MSLENGAAAPAFTAPRDGGAEVSLSDFAGKSVVLYFYPRDDTPGCTTEANEFTAASDQFAAAGAVIIGVSKDTVAKHDKFVAKHDLGVMLVSDADSTICEDYGVWVEKNMYGRKSMGIERATFLIGPDGSIRQIWRKVKVKGHVDEVLTAVQAP
ncbi:MAG: thioredoxin-dependent thiol peroxidase [Pseudomonadota bacterium]